MPTIKLIPSFAWDCPNCNTENIVRVYDDDEKPTDVCCKKCGREYECEMDDEDTIFAADDDDDG